MVKCIGAIPEAKPRSWRHRLTAPLSAVARQVAELEEGAGLRRLAGRLAALDLGDRAVLVVRPALGFMTVDLCLIGPGRALVMNALHWAGDIVPGKKGEWRGAGGKVDLGRPDRRARVFCDRLAFSGRARSIALEPVVVFTAGPARCLSDDAEAALVQWDELEPFVHSRIHPSAVGFPAEDLVRLISPPGTRPITE